MGKVWGPYEQADGRWRVVVRAPGSERDYRYFKTEREAEKIADAVRAEFKQESLTIAGAIDLYMEHQELKGNKESTRKTTRFRLDSMFPDQTDQYVIDIEKRHAQKLYDKLCKTGKKVDTHRNTLNQTRSFWKWLKKRDYVYENPWEEVEGVGRRNKGKPQLTAVESRRLLDHLQARAGGDEGALGAMVALLLGLRSGEVVSLRVRDIDFDAGVAHIRGGKTDAATRRVVLPEVLASTLLATILPEIPDRGGDRELFAGSRHWLRSACLRLCREAGVTEVGPHGLRGTHASLASSAGMSSRAVAETLGHASPNITERHYSTEESRAAGKQKRVLKLLKGGK